MCVNLAAKDDLNRFKRGTLIRLHLILRGREKKNSQGLGWHELLQRCKTASVIRPVEQY